MVACPACESARSRRAPAVRELSFRRCAACASLFVENPPGGEAIASLYRDQGYFEKGRLGPGASDEALGYAGYLDDRAHIEAKFETVLARLERYARPGELLDVGAGPGLMLSVAERRGWSARGIELNPWAAQHARRRLGVRVSTGAFETAALAPGRLAAVTMMDFLEHLPAPAHAVAKAARATRPGGLLAILTPDAGAMVGRLLGARWPELMKAPGHLVLFSVRGLVRLLERHGYGVLGWHSVGKTSTLETLLTDGAPAAPAAARALQRLLGAARLGGRTLTLDPRTKVCLYARLGPGPPPQAALSRSL